MFLFNTQNGHINIMVMKRNVSFNKMFTASPNYAILFKKIKQNIFIFKIKNNFTTMWNKNR